jgi:hypothetical protein
MSVLAKKFGTSMLLLTAAAVLIAVVAFAPNAKADQVCVQVSGQTQCFESSHVYLDPQDRDFYARHGRLDLVVDR